MFQIINSWLWKMVPVEPVEFFVLCCSLIILVLGFAKTNKVWLRCLDLFLVALGSCLLIMGVIGWIIA